MFIALRLGTVPIRQGQLVLYFRAWVGRYNITTTEDIREALVKFGQFSRTVVTNACPQQTSKAVKVVP